MAFFSSKSSETGSSRASAKKVDNRTTTADTAPTTEERFTDSSVASRSSGTRDSPGDVSSKNPTKLFDFGTKRNWAGAVKRCKGEDKKEASQWIVEHNKDGTIRWKLLPIHQVREFIARIVAWDEIAPLLTNANIFISTKIYMFFVNPLHRRAKIRLLQRLSKRSSQLIQNL